MGTEKINEKECNNGYTDTNMYIESYGSDKSVSNCEGCAYFNFIDGIVTCKKFNKENKQ